MKERIESMLVSRNSQYGDYKGGLELRVKIMDLILDRHMAVNRQAMDPIDYAAVLDIVNKLTRIAVTTRHIDSWMDLIGYSTININRINEEESNAVEPRPQGPTVPSS